MIKEFKTVITTYTVEDNYGKMHSFSSKREAEMFEKYVQEDRKILSYIWPIGITLVVSLNDMPGSKVFPAFMGYRGVPFCDIMKDKHRDFYLNLWNSVERNSSIYGNLREVLKKAYAVATVRCKETFNTWQGAYHYRWDIKYGNPIEYATHPNRFTQGVLWYNWDGQIFRTNDPNCTIKAVDLE